MTQRTAAKKRFNQGKLNWLSGTDWIKFTKTWFVLHSGSRRDKILHPASFPESIVENFVSFFTREGDWVLDPFLGSGSTCLMSKKMGRNSVGIELYQKYVKLTNDRLSKLHCDDDVKAIVIRGDSRNILNIMKDLDMPLMNFCLTSPPYWNQLLKNSERNKIRNENNLECTYGKDELDLGLINDYQTFLLQQKFIFDDIYELMKDKAYLVIVTNNIYKNGKLWPLAFDTLKTLSEKWVPKDEMIWCQDDKKLFPFGMYHSYIGNRSHHYCLVFQKQI